jgi:hypothetical protein
LEDLEDKLINVRREGYVCFKMIGDLVNAEYAPAETAMDIMMAELDSNSSNSSGINNNESRT